MCCVRDAKQNYELVYRLAVENNIFYLTIAYFYIKKNNTLFMDKWREKWKGHVEAYLYTRCARLRTGKYEKMLCLLKRKSTKNTINLSTAKKQTEQ